MIPAVSSWIKNRYSQYFGKFYPGDIAGAFGDIGTFLPLWLALVVICGLDPAASLVLAGAANIITGFAFKIPMAVQPMKAIAAVAIAMGFGQGAIAGAGILMGIIMLSLGYSKAMQKVTELVPAPVVRGVQWAVAIQLGLAGIRVMYGDLPTRELLGSFYPLALGALLLAAIAGAYYRKTLIVSVSLLGACAGLGYYFWSDAGSIAVPAASWSLALPTAGEFKQGFLYAVIPQIPMTCLNSVAAVAGLAIALFPDKKQLMDTNKISKSVGIINLIACPLGGMPMCHGSGGLAGQYAFGARSGFSVVFLGVLKLGVGLTCAAFFAGFSQYVPKSVLGVWVIVAGVELLRSTLPGLKRVDLATTLTLPVVSMASGSLPAAVASSWALHQTLTIIRTRRATETE